VQSKTNFLRLVKVETPVSAPIEDDLGLEADKIEALNGPNLYSTFLRKHGYRPSRQQAFAIGRIMGARVRASDGTMQPELAAGEKAAIRAIKKRRKEWAKQTEHIHRTIAAVSSLFENEHEPSTVILSGADVFYSATFREQLKFAVDWLNRFAEELHHHEQDSCSKSPQRLECHHRDVAE
jgi:hypothetical protein